jgi:hypothetical protein
MNRNAPAPGLFLGFAIGAALTAYGVWFSRRLEEERDPLLHVLDHAPVDDEELTPEDVAAIDEARADLALGNLTPWDHVRHELRHSA